MDAFHTHTCGQYSAALVACTRVQFADACCCTDASRDVEHDRFDLEMGLLPLQTAQMIVQRATTRESTA